MRDILTVNELFAGIGSQRKALERLGVPHKVIGISEIDKYAIKSYEEIHGKIKNYGDIKIAEKLDYADFWTYSFPCCDVSVAGKQAGINENTRSGLLYQVERLLNVSKEHNELPKYLMLENVKNLVGKKFKPQFDEWLKYLERLGYNNYWKVLNAKDFGIPQNRERVFVISIRKDIDKGKYKFPEPFQNGIRLKDFLEEKVAEKFYISKEIQDRFRLQFISENIVGTTKNEAGTSFGQRDWVYNPEACIGTLTATDYKQPKQIIESNALIQVGTLKGCGKPYDNMHDQSGRVYNIEGICPTVNTCGGGNLEPKILEPSREFDKGGLHDISTTILSHSWECNNFEPETPLIVASRGRYRKDGKTEQQLEINGTGYANTITTVQKDCMVLESCIDKKPSNITNIKFGTFVALDTGRKQRTKHNIPNKKNIYIDNTLHKLIDFRIRKLTPKECWRLMGFDDSDFEKAEKVNSNTQLYKQAGNSIVVDVLYYIFREAFAEYISENEDIESEAV